MDKNETLDFPVQCTKSVHFKICIRKDEEFLLWGVYTSQLLGCSVMLGLYIGAFYVVFSNLFGQLVTYLTLVPCSGDPKCPAPPCTNEV